MIWIDPTTIRFKIIPQADLRGTVAGDWDIERRRPLTDSVKYRSVVAHFRDGIQWQDTDLFAETYARRLATGERLRGATTLDDLAARYTAQIDPIFASMKRHGFKATNGLPHLIIGRGEVFIGNQGNHRIAIAHVLGLDRFAGEIVCRHPQA